MLKGTGPELYRNPTLFFTNTHPTRGLKTLIKAVLGRLTGTDNQLGSILRLDNSYGGGKTHALNRSGGTPPAKGVGVSGRQQHQQAADSH